MRFLQILFLLLALAVISQARRHHGGGGVDKFGRSHLHHRGSLIHHRRHKFHGPYGQYVNHYDRHHLKFAHRGHGWSKSVADKPRSFLATEEAIEEVPNKKEILNDPNNERDEDGMASVGDIDHQEDGQLGVGHRRSGLWKPRFKHHRSSSRHTGNDQEHLDEENSGSHRCPHRHGRHGGRYHHNTQVYPEVEPAKNEIESPNEEVDDKVNDEDKREVGCRGYHRRHRGGGGRRHHWRHHHDDGSDVDEINSQENNDNHPAFHRRRNGGRFFHIKSQDPNGDTLNVDKDADINTDSDEEYYGSRRRWHSRHRHNHHHHRRTHSKPEIFEEDYKDLDVNSSSNENLGTTEKVMIENTTESIIDKIDVRLAV
ncbi:histidine-rich glycoprotein-like [Musca vetustissima]|uniref:histidine-rich glycoprotein-like n=1 Tax=Musca vetustissima TaxID=27455 RepID=UPI002AB71497|nr:histidine-rich glycoprotein-like [Musca vetustissima]